MKKKSSLIGIDIGDNLLKISLISYVDNKYIIEKNEKYNVLKYMDNGNIINIKEIQQLIKNFIISNTILKPKLLFIIPNKNYDFLQTKIFKMETLSKKEEMKGAIQTEIEDIFSYSNDKYKTQWKILSNDFQDKTLVFSTCYKKEIIDTYKQLAKNLKYSYALVSKNFLYSDLIEKSDFNKTTLFIDIGYNTTDLIVYKYGFPICIRSINIGGDSITKIISSFNNISYEDAENMKINNGLIIRPDTPYDFSQEERELSEIIETQIKLITVEIKNIREQLLTTFSLDIDNIYLLGGSSYILYLDNYIEYNTNIPCKKIIPQYLNDSYNETLLEFAELNYFINAISGSYSNFMEKDNNFYFENEKYINEKLPIYILSCSAIFVFCLFTISIFGNIQANEKLKESDIKLKSIQSQYSTYENKANDLVSQINIYNDKINHVNNILNTLNNIDNIKVIPNDILLLLKSHTPDKVQIDTISYENNILVIEGVVPNYATLGYYLKELETVNEFNDTTYEYATLNTTITNDFQIQNLKFKITTNYSKN